MSSRIFTAADFVQLSDGEPIRSVITESPEAVAIVWHLLPGQEIAPHFHPAGQDTWVILQGAGEYITDSLGTTMPIAAGQVVVARTGEVHGVRNQSSEPLQFISILAPENAGFQPLSHQGDLE